MLLYRKTCHFEWLTSQRRSCFWTASNSAQNKAYSTEKFEQHSVWDLARTFHNPLIVGWNYKLRSRAFSIVRNPWFCIRESTITPFHCLSPSWNWWNRVSQKTTKCKISWCFRRLQSMRKNIIVSQMFLHFRQTFEARIITICLNRFPQQHAE